jgi:hypothetical protein
MINPEHGRNDPSSRDAAAPRGSEASVKARQQLIHAMIENNSRQLRFEAARAGADIEQAGAMRDLAREPTDRDAAARLEEVKKRIAILEDEHRRLVTEREWINKSLAEFGEEAGEPLADPRQLS